MIGMIRVERIDGRVDTYADATAWFVDSDGILSVKPTIDADCVIATYAPGRWIRVGDFKP